MSSNLFVVPRSEQSLELQVVLQSLRSLARRAERLTSQVELHRATQLQRQLVEDLKRAWIGSSADLGILLELLTAEPTPPKLDTWRLALWVALDLGEAAQPSTAVRSGDEGRRVH